MKNSSGIARVVNTHIALSSLTTIKIKKRSISKQKKKLIN